MIIRKDWLGFSGLFSFHKKRVAYRGWFLLGIIPLYIIRIDL